MNCTFIAFTIVTFVNQLYYTFLLFPFVSVQEALACMVKFVALNSFYSFKVSGDEKIEHLNVSDHFALERTHSTPTFQEL